jgi:hypothetical protein
MKKVIVIAVVILLLLSGTAVTVLYYIGDKMLNTVIDSEINDLLVEEPSTSQNMSPNANEQTGSASGNKLSQQPSGNITDEITNPSGNSDQKPETPESNISKPETSNSNDQKIQYTVEQMNEVKEKVTAVDKISSAALLIKRLNTADINELKSMLPGGVDAAEKKRAKEIMYQRFTPEEIETIQSLYQKYMDD